MRVRTEADILTTLDAVDRLLAPLGKELENRRLSSRVFESASEARRAAARLKYRARSVARPASAALPSRGSTPVATPARTLMP
jgi:hypothetical protein